MIIWVKKEAIDANTDQRANIESIHGTKIVVCLCGINELHIIQLYDIVGIELNKELTIKFEYKGHNTIS